MDNTLLLIFIILVALSLCGGWYGWSRGRWF